MSHSIVTWTCDQCELKFAKSTLGLPEGWMYVDTGEHVCSKDCRENYEERQQELDRIADDARLD